MLNYEQNLKLNHLIADRLLERLFIIPFIPDHILNIGCIDDYIYNKLIKHYSNATIHNLQKANNVDWLAENLYKLPFANNSFDLVIANLTMECNDPNLVSNFKELHRVMRIGSLLLFTMGNYKNLGQNELMNIGDLLLKNQFCDPVIDQDLLTINYHNTYNTTEHNNNHNQDINIELIYGHALSNSLVKTSIVYEI